MEPILSVVIPTYNRPLQLPKLLESIQSQTFKDFEVIVCDDASVIKYAEPMINGTKHQITLIQQETNQGEVMNVYTGMSLCKGEYIYVIHDDDVLTDPRVFEEAVYYLEKYKPTMLMASHQTHNVKTGQYKRVYQPCDGWITSAFQESILTSNPTIMGGFFINKKAVQEVGYFDMRYKYYSDWDLLIRISTLDDFSIYYWRRIIITYNLHSVSQSGKLAHDPKAKTEEMDYLQELVKEIREMRASVK